MGQQRAARVRRALGPFGHEMIVEQRRIAPRCDAGPIGIGIEHIGPVR